MLFGGPTGTNPAAYPFYRRVWGFNDAIGVSFSKYDYLPPILPLFLNLPSGSGFLMISSAFFRRLSPSVPGRCSGQSTTPLSRGRGGTHPLLGTIGFLHPPTPGLPRENHRHRNGTSPAARDVHAAEPVTVRRSMSMWTRRGDAGEVTWRYS